MLYSNQMNKTVLITGASSGIGFALAKLFAQDNYDLVLVAKDAEKLKQAAQRLQNETTTIYTIAKDLSIPKSPNEIYEEVKKKQIQIDVLINNAGFATYGLFIENDLEKELEELQLNIVTLTHLTKLFAREMVMRKTGTILNIASTAAFLPGPLMAVYYASKAYVLSFSEALANELHGTGISLSILAPGPTKTGFVKRAHLEKSKLFQGDVMDVDEVAKIAYKGLLQKKTLIIPGRRNQLMTSVIKLMPRMIVPSLVRKFQSPA